MVADCRKRVSNSQRLWLGTRCEGKAACCWVAAVTELAAVHFFICLFGVLGQRGWQPPVCLYRVLVSFTVRDWVVAGCRRVVSNVRLQRPSTSCQRSKVGRFPDADF